MHAGSLQLPVAKFGAKKLIFAYYVKLQKDSFALGTPGTILLLFWWWLTKVIGHVSVLS
jgi:hypothetical protein